MKSHLHNHCPNTWTQNLSGKESAWAQGEADSSSSPTPTPLNKRGRCPKSPGKTAVQHPPRAETRLCVRATHVTAKRGT